MFCNNCGNELKEGLKFCNKCGQRIAESAYSNREPEGEKSNKSDKGSKVSKNTKMKILIGSLIAVILILVVSIVALILIKNKEAREEAEKSKKKYSKVVTDEASKETSEDAVEENVSSNEEVSEDTEESVESEEEQEIQEPYTIYAVSKRTYKEKYSYDTMMTTEYSEYEYENNVKWPASILIQGIDYYTSINSKITLPYAVNEKNNLLADNRIDEVMDWQNVQKANISYMAKSTRYESLNNGDVSENDEYCKNEYEYDENGRIKARHLSTFYKNNSDPNSRFDYSYTYSTDGLLIKCDKRENFGSGDMISWDEYIYDSEGKIIKATTYYHSDSGDNESNNITFDYDSRGNLTKITNVGGPSYRYQNIVTMSYDDNGNIVSYEKSSSESGSRDNYVFSYDDKNNIIGISYNGNNDSYEETYEYSYDPDGRVLDISCYRNGEYDWNASYDYSNDGYSVTNSSPKSSYTSIIEYDVNGNLIKQIFSSSDVELEWGYEYVKIEVDSEGIGRIVY
ncbi:MAG: hypothetical protein MJZ11_06160 [Lachnospiraceae bacterium]|nr:hypothetical protein [Lachnospiraceae bacterium]